jgi:hypothetical protein
VKSVAAGADLTGTASAANLVLDCRQFGTRAYSCKGAACKVGVCAEKADGVNVLSLDPPPSILAGVIPGWTPGVVQHVADFFLTRESRAPAILAARAGGSPNDALLLQDNKGVHWGPALKRVLEGSYCLRVSHLSATPDTKTLMIEWDRAVDPEGAVAVAGLAAGGYALEKATSGTCSPDPEASPSWVVVVPQARFAQLESQWEQTANWVGQLADQGASQPTLTTARHMVLAAIAEVVEKP